LYSKYCRPDKVAEFSESGCLGGGLGIFPATNIMPLAMANALKLNKYGA
jgi:2,3-bisphosphoglycerate-independent phosphoglycerate mutase